MDIKYTDRFWQDLERTLVYIICEFYMPMAARNISNTIFKNISNLQIFPYMGKRYRNPYRMLIVKKYIIFYLVKDDYVEIHRIIHHRQSRRNLF